MLPGGASQGEKETQVKRKVISSGGDVLVDVGCDVGRFRARILPCCVSSCWGLFDSWHAKLHLPEALGMREADVASWLLALKGFIVCF